MLSTIHRSFPIYVCWAFTIKPFPINVSHHLSIHKIRTDSVKFYVNSPLIAQKPRTTNGRAMKATVKEAQVDYGVYTCGRDEVGWYRGVSYITKFLAIWTILALRVIYDYTDIYVQWCRWHHYGHTSAMSHIRIKHQLLSTLVRSYDWVQC